MSSTIYSKAGVDAKLAKAASAPAQLLGGRPWGFGGDSITHGSTAANGRRFVDYVPHLVGTANMAPITPLSPAAGAVYSVENGGPGERSDQILARIDALIAGGAKGICLLAGTNNASQSISVAAFMADMATAQLKCRLAGIPLVVGTVPPRASSAAAGIHQLIAAYNLALRAWAPAAGVHLAEVHGALADITTGYLAAALDSGDGTHPNTAGHRKIAEAFTVAVRRTFATQPPIVASKSPVSLMANPLFSANTSGWFEQPGGSGTAPTYSRVADTTGRLPAGAQWYEMDFDGTASGGTRTLASAVGGTYAASDLLLVCGQIDIIDVSGGFYAAANADPATAAIKYGLNYNGSFVAGPVLPPLGQVPGELALPVTASQSSGLVLWLTVTVPTGVRAKVRLSGADVRNLTALGATGF